MEKYKRLVGINTMSVAGSIENNYFMFALLILRVRPY